MVEILKQGQLQPLPVEKQILIIYAGVNAYLDDIPVELCRKFEDELYRFAENAHPELLAQIRDKKTLDDDLKGRINKMLDEVKQRFTADHAQTAAARA